MFAEPLPQGKPCPRRKRPCTRPKDAKRARISPRPSQFLQFDDVTAMRLRFSRALYRLVGDGHGRGGDIPAEHIHQRKRATRQENDPSRYTPTGFLNLFVHEDPCCPSVAARVLPPAPRSVRSGI